MITSTSNDKIKDIIKLNKSKYRKETNLFIVEGDHLVQEAKKLNLLKEVYSLNSEGTIVSESVMKRIANTNTVCPIIGICKIESKEEVSNKVLILDKIADPGNLGTLMRSAVAFGFNTIFCADGSVDYYNDKVIRSSQGAIFKLNLLSGNIVEFINNINKTHKVYGTNVVNGISLSELEKSRNLAIILGNEANGISEEVFNIVEKNIYIEMENTESLNVGVAGSIIMYHLK